MSAPPAFPRSGLVALAALLFLPACAATRANGGATHTYYVAADELMWDYAPTDTNRITGETWNPLDKEFVERRPDRVGRVYKKAVYHEYTDSSFTTLKPRPPEWEHLGILGPLLRGTVGDTIRVVFRNNGTHPYSMHPHGVIYKKDSEGAGYADGSSAGDKADDGVPPQGTYVYLWPIPERAGPGPHEGSSVMWMYHSHTNEALDVNAGLIGPMIVTARGKAKADGTPVDVDRELMVMFAEFDENFSWFKDENFGLAKLDLKKVPAAPTFADPFYLANLRETMNGLSFGTLPGLVVKQGERVRWYLFALTGFEMHAPHWHGQTAIENGMRTDVAPLISMEMKIADMVPDNPGTWLFHCHVSPHLIAGMQALFKVE
jgi:FtsP/CotA-like multicopper oxidase with cupredoxin domain